MKTSPPLSVLHVSSEVAPFAKTGGLGDVVAALPDALAAAGLKTTIVMPRYRSVDARRHLLARRLEPIEVPLGGRAERVTVYEGRLPHGVVPVYLLEHPLFDREGLYGDAAGDYPDNGRRFALLSRGALELAHRFGFWPDVVHAHDWQAGLTPLYAKRAAVAGGRVPATVFTIHNLAFQGLQPREIVDELGLGWDVFTPEAAEFYGQLSLLKAGIAWADRVTTVSPRYAREIQTAEQGAGLEGFLRKRADRLVGILNGIDLGVWSPDRDPHLPVRYDARDRSGKSACKAALQRELGLPVRAQVPLVGSISRLTEQKGFDLVAAAGDELARLDAQFLFLGTGDKKFVDALLDLQRRYPMKVAVRVAYDDAVAHRIYAGSDFFLMPSHFEPCGLSQLYSLRYGTIPIVRATGGLDDSIVDWDERTRTGTGFKFAEYTPAALAACVKRALTAYRHHDPFNELVARAMGLDHGWAVSARRYVEVYRELVAGATGAGARKAG